MDCVCREDGSPSGKDIRNLRLVRIGRAGVCHHGCELRIVCERLVRQVIEKPPAAHEFLFEADGFGDFHEGAPVAHVRPRPDEHMLVRHGLEHLDWVLQRRQSFAREVVWAEQSPGATLLKMSEMGIAARLNPLDRARNDRSRTKRLSRTALIWPAAVVAGAFSL